MNERTRQFLEETAELRGVTHHKKSSVNGPTPPSDPEQYLAATSVGWSEADPNRYTLHSTQPEIKRARFRLVNGTQKRL